MIIKALSVRFSAEVACHECKVDGDDALWFQVETKKPGSGYLYLVGIVVDGDTVKVIEARGKKADLLKDLGTDGWKKMLESIR
jgi:hypothetical protein